MKPLAIASLFVLCASLAAAGLTPGAAVPNGEALPIIADLNGDGLADIVQDRTVLLNLGSEQFQKIALPLASNNEIVKDWLDVNGDGRPDLLVNSLAVYPPPGYGTAPLAPSTWAIYIAGNFPTYTQVGLALPAGAMPFVADVNRDGKDDIVAIKALFQGVRDLASEWTVMISRGDGTFDVRPAFRTLSNPQTGQLRHLLMGDMDSDGHADIVARFTNDVAILRGDGSGNFTPGAARYVPFGRFGGWDTQLADVDGDGNLDLIMAYRRSVKVLFGDGHGGFARMATASMPQLRTVSVNALFQNLFGDDSNAPRTLGIGHFVSSARTEIAGGTPEGDLVIVGWENGALREVGRLATAFLLPDVRVGAFRPGHTDLYLTWVSDFMGMNPQPQLFNADASATKPAVRMVGRTRASRPAAPASWNVSYKSGGDCTPGEVEDLALTNDGIFGHYQSDRESIDIVRDEQEGAIFLRLVPTWAATYEWIDAKLQPTPRGYVGSADNIPTPCGYITVSFVVSPHS